MYCPATSSIFFTRSQVFLNYPKNLLQHFSRNFLLCYRHLFLETRNRLKRPDLPFSVLHEQAKALDQNQGHHHLLGLPDQIPGHPQSFTPLLSPPIPNPSWSSDNLTSSHPCLSRQHYQGHSSLYPGHRVSLPSDRSHLLTKSCPKILLCVLNCHPQLCTLAPAQCLAQGRVKSTLATSLRTIKV